MKLLIIELTDHGPRYGERAKSMPKMDAFVAWMSESVRQRDASQVFLLARISSLNVSNTRAKYRTSIGVHSSFEHEIFIFE